MGAEGIVGSKARVEETGTGLGDQCMDLQGRSSFQVPCEFSGVYLVCGSFDLKCSLNKQKLYPIPASMVTPNARKLDRIGNAYPLGRTLLHHAFRHAFRAAFRAASACATHPKSPAAADGTHSPAGLDVSSRRTEPSRSWHRVVTGFGKWLEGL